MEENSSRLIWGTKGRETSISQMQLRNITTASASLLSDTQ
jgi:hypothetical protein